MSSSLSKNIQLIRNMGLRYVSFRAGFELEKKLGVLKKKFPQDPPPEKFITLAEWRKNTHFWGIVRKKETGFDQFPAPDIAPLMKGQMPFFSAQWFNLGMDYDWVTNPDTGYRYDPTLHWTKIQDYSKTAGDIKFVWEKSRFSYLYDIIRHDMLKKEDHSEWVFNEISSWLNANKINSGPNYRCSQEISLRVLNWTYALNFYKDSDYLSEELFQKIMHTIYWQLKHIYSNINFSRIAVRNNHAITETLTLYLGALFYPSFPEAALWKRDGKKWFEQEIAYQIYPDGSFLQFSMNYHRVVVQLLTWALKTAYFFDEKYDEVVYDRAYKSLRFLYACQDNNTGWLPNYGSNDGALFFKLNSCDYRDYRPQLNVLHLLLTGTSLYNDGNWDEDMFWFQAQQVKGVSFPALKHEEGWNTFENGGYYILREAETLTFIRCGSHKDRPAQADNLHLDIWHKGQNVLFDGGSYKYNADEKVLKYFMGTESHNTVMLDNFDQMEKGPRFIWYNWTQSVKAYTGDNDEIFWFEGEIRAFKNVGNRIRHYRKVMKHKGIPHWIVEDSIINKPESAMLKQFWHATQGVSLAAREKEGTAFSFRKEKGMRSDYYGVKTEAVEHVAETKNDSITTDINIQ